MTTLSIKEITRSFHQGDETLEILHGISFDINPGEIVALVGHSGAGKSTLLQIAGLLEPPTTGQVIMSGRDTAGMSEDERTALRNQYVGFVYQFHHLLPEFSALENVMMPQLIGGVSIANAEVRAHDLLTKLGLSHRVDHRPKKLSGGEQQRVAIARALANSPKILLADEPTGNLDYATSDVVFAEMMQLVRDTGMSALIATHNPDLAKRMDRIIEIKAGKLI